MKKRAEQTNPDGEVFRIPEAAAYCRLGAATIRRAIQHGDLKAAKLGIAPRSPILIKKEWLDAWIDSMTIETAAA